MKGTSSKYLFLTIVAVLFLTSAGCRQLEKKIDDYLYQARYLWDFNGAVLVAHDGEIFFQNAYGLADRDIGDPNTIKTVYYIGSISKQFTAAAIMLLVQRGELSLDDPITKYLPDWPAETGDKITIHHLLTHTSGIHNYTEIPEVILKRTSGVSPSQLIASFRDWPLDFEPGTQFHYSNSGYVVLGAIIEQVAKQSFEAFLHHNILNPLGMTTTGYARLGVPNRARGYTKDVGGRIVDAVTIQPAILHTAGALFSTVEDMARWDNELYHNHIISKESVEKMFTPQYGNYGYGWIIDSKFNRKRVYHGGFIDGFNSTIQRWVDDKLTIIVFSNTEDSPVDKIALGIAAIIFDRPYDRPIKKESVHLGFEKIKPYEGVYEIYPGYHLYVSAGPDTLIANFTGETPQLLFPESENRFFFNYDNTRTATFTDITDTTGNITIADKFTKLFGRKLNEYEARKVQIKKRTVEIDPKIYEFYTGIYRLESNLYSNVADFLLIVNKRGNRLFASVNSPEEVELYPASQTEFFHANSDFSIVFEYNDEGHVTGCVLKMGGYNINGVKIR